MIYRLRIILDVQEDVFRDIEIEKTATLEDFHNAITQSFGFGGQEMASFYLSDENWEEGEEIPLFDMEDGGDTSRTMTETKLEDVLSKDRPQLIYIYDFLKMWTFLIELAESVNPQHGRSYPSLIYAHGTIPEEAPEKEFISEKKENIDPLDEDLDPEDYEDLDFDENWN